MKRIRIVLMGCALLISGAVFAAGKDQYHVYKLGSGECVIDTCDHGKMKDQRGTDFCLGHFDYRMDAEKRRAGLVKSGACKCPAGENC